MGFLATLTLGVATTALLTITPFIIVYGYLRSKEMPIVRYPYPEEHSEVEAKRTVLIAGSFNPPHHGHLNMIDYLSRAHKKVYVVVGFNRSKKYHVSAQDRCEVLREMVEHLELKNVQVEICDGIVFRYAMAVGATRLYRGIRTWHEDGHDELQLQTLNIIGPLTLNFRAPIPTHYIQSAPEYAHISSSLVRGRVKRGEDVSDLMPYVSTRKIQELYGDVNSTT